MGVSFEFIYSGNCTQSVGDDEEARKLKFRPAEGFERQKGNSQIKQPSN